MSPSSSNHSGILWESSTFPSYPGIGVGISHIPRLSRSWGGNLPHCQGVRVESSTFPSYPGIGVGISHIPRLSRYWAENLPHCQGVRVGIFNIPRLSRSWGGNIPCFLGIRVGIFSVSQVIQQLGWESSTFPRYWGGNLPHFQVIQLLGWGYPTFPGSPAIGVGISHISRLSSYWGGDIPHFQVLQLLGWGYPTFPGYPAIGVGISHISRFSSYWGGDIPHFQVIQLLGWGYPTFPGYPAIGVGISHISRLSSYWGGDIPHFQVIQLLGWGYPTFPGYPAIGVGISHISRLSSYWGGDIPHFQVIQLLGWESPTFPNYPGIGVGIFPISRLSRYWGENIPCFPGIGVDVSHIPRLSRYWGGNLPHFPIMQVLGWESPTFPGFPGIRVGIFYIPEVLGWESPTFPGFPGIWGGNLAHCQVSSPEELPAFGELRLQFYRALLLEGFWQSREFSLQGWRYSTSGFPGWFPRVGRAASLPGWNSIGMPRGFPVIPQSLFIPMDFVLLFQRQPWTAVSLCRNADCAAHTLPKHCLFQEFTGNLGLKYSSGCLQPVQPLESQAVPSAPWHGENPKPQSWLMECSPGILHRAFTGISCGTINLPQGWEFVFPPSWLPVELGILFFTWMFMGTVSFLSIKINTEPVRFLVLVSDHGRLWKGFVLSMESWIVGLGRTSEAELQPCSMGRELPFQWGLAEVRNPGKGRAQHCLLGVFPHFSRQD
ncbi:uncharacterized protein LOC127059125 isoform X27 [Serinus canaria]|uniref:uncharacterized protein LOC127059125 isoform X23 n=1 Tax=Serinus canaria TaxID=9135 RepID=UPI0021CC55BE|nr:uncharacterized protein LOC127059125 isoform X23 [Serinus canaria]XP_050825941.1 uncharacterized protein LOC127059125 isoform X27 [Serinus canaria]